MIVTLNMPVRIHVDACLPITGEIMNENEGLREEIEQAINRHSAENGSDTPDFVLAAYLIDCLKAFDKAVSARNRWHKDVKAINRE